MGEAQQKRNHCNQTATRDEARPTPECRLCATFARVPELDGGRVLGQLAPPAALPRALLAKLVNRDAANEGAVEPIAKAMADQP
jgi:hypothetical protein